MSRLRHKTGAVRDCGTAARWRNGRSGRRAIRGWTASSPSKFFLRSFSVDVVRKHQFENSITKTKTISSLNHFHIRVLYDVGHLNGISLGWWESWRKGRTQRDG